jgi:hypothetical protein
MFLSTFAFFRDDARRGSIATTKMKKMGSA